MENIQFFQCDIYIKILEDYLVYLWGTLQSTGKK